MPIRRQSMAMCVVVSMICGNPIGAVQYCDEVRQQVDKHLRPGRGWAAQAIAKNERQDTRASNKQQEMFPDVRS
jgi:hypothetical protein